MPSAGASSVKARTWNWHVSGAFVSEPSQPASQAQLPVWGSQTPWPLQSSRHRWSPLLPSRSVTDASRVPVASPRSASFVTPTYKVCGPTLPRMKWMSELS